MTRLDTSSCTSPSGQRPRCAPIAVFGRLGEAPPRTFDVPAHNALWTAASSERIGPPKLDKAPALAYFGISAALARAKVDVAAGALRRHLEYASWHLADELGATPQFRADGDYDLGGLLPSVVSRMKDLLGKAADAAQSWEDGVVQKIAVERRKELSAATAALSVDRWAVNKAVHYNEWANFSKSDFEPVVAVAKSLLKQYRCDNCGSWLYVTPKRGAQEALRCLCASINLNLKAKPK